MICETLLFLSALFIYGKSIYSCLRPTRNVEEPELNRLPMENNIDEDEYVFQTISSENNLLNSNSNLNDTTFLIIRINRPLPYGFVSSLFECNEVMIPVNKIVEPCKKEDLCNITKNDECPICLDNLFDTDATICKLPCNHSYCQPCIYSWLKTSPKCPLCNQNSIQLWYKKHTE